MKPQEIEQYLAELGAELKSQGIKKPVRMLLIGGAYMMLVANAPRTTGLLHSREEPREDGNKKEPFADMKGRNKFISTDERSIHERYNNFSQPSSSQ